MEKRQGESSGKRCARAKAKRPHNREQLASFSCGLTRLKTFYCHISQTTEQSIAQEILDLTNKSTFNSSLADREKAVSKFQIFRAKTVSNVAVISHK